MMYLKELTDGTYSLYDLEVMHQIIDFKAHVSVKKEEVEIPLH